MNTPLILIYTTFFGKPLDVGAFDCDVPGRFTLDKGRIAEAAAVVFHIPDFREAGDAWKFPGQYWVAWTMESRSNHGLIGDPAILRHFDFTMTHERRSDVWAPYLPAESWWSDVRQRPVRPKTEPAPLVLFQSARFNHSGRVDLVRELSSLMAVDAYGRHNPTRVVDGPDLGHRTKIDTVSRYRFCLALENSIEEDYVTEKLFNAFEAGSVPVYLGAPNVREFAPPGSYIDVADFGSAAELAGYLRYLIETPEAYKAYFAWRMKSLPDALSRRIEEAGTEPFCNLLRLVDRASSDRQAPASGRPVLPFGLRSYAATRLRKWRRKVPG